MLILHTRGGRTERAAPFFSSLGTLLQGKRKQQILHTVVWVNSVLNHGAGFILDDFVIGTLIQTVNEPTLKINQTTVVP